MDFYLEPKKSAKHQTTLTQTIGFFPLETVIEIISVDSFFRAEPLGIQKSKSTLHR